MEVYGSLWKSENMNSGWVYLCVVYIWYVYGYMRIGAYLWKPIEGYWYGT